MLMFVVQDIERLYPEERNIVKVTLVEANQILSSFDTRLRSYAERKIRQRSQMNLLSGSVVGLYVCQNARDMPTMVSTDHHSDKMATTINSLTSTKISTRMKILTASCFTQHIHTYTVSIRNLLGIK